MTLRPRKDGRPPTPAVAGAGEPKMLRILIFAGACALMLGTAHAQTVGFGQRGDANAQVEVSADALKVDQSNGQATFTGNVLIGQGEMRLTADSVTVTYAAGGQQKIQALNASGGVTLVSGADAAEANEAVYDVASGKITLSGDAIVTQGQSVLAGDKIEVNLIDGTASVAGRVRTILQPGNN